MIEDLLQQKERSEDSEDVHQGQPYQVMTEDRLQQKERTEDSKDVHQGQPFQVVYTYAVRIQDM
jgi:hypothetical protein